MVFSRFIGKGWVIINKLLFKPAAMGHFAATERHQVGIRSPPATGFYHIHTIETIVYAGVPSGEEGMHSA